MKALKERLVALHLTPHLGEKTLNGLISGGETRIEEAFAASEEHLRDSFHFHPQAAGQFYRKKDRFLEDARLLIASLERAGADLLHPLDNRYPERFRALKGDAPPLLYLSGDLNLLETPTICFLASSGASPQTLRLIRSLADSLAEEGYVLVTGHNRDTYQAAALATAQFVSPVIYVLDCGLFAVNAQGQDHPFPAARIHDTQDQRRLFLSPFRPKDPWIGHNNRKRDRLIAALAHLVVAVEVRSGGVMEKECLGALKRGQRVVALAPDGRIPDVHSRLFDAGAMLIQTPEELLRHLWDAGIGPP